MSKTQNVIILTGSDHEVSQYIANETFLSNLAKLTGDFCDTGNVESLHEFCRRIDRGLPYAEGADERHTKIFRIAKEWKEKKENKKN